MEIVTWIISKLSLIKKNAEDNGIHCIIDNKKVIDGSYNWSNNAKDNLEHLIIIESRNVAKMYNE
jgi:hypothetical protein